MIDNNKYTLMPLHHNPIKYLNRTNKLLLKTLSIYYPDK